MQVTVVLRLDEGKFDRWLRDGVTPVYMRELSYGFTWDRTGSNKTHFEQALINFMHEMESRQQRLDFIQKEMDRLPVHPFREQFIDGCIPIWSEGDLG
ncbi:hypothetical protein SUGI_0462930 [Cryptomeria japonica]|nr:hypothetical protein SUGI_0462930 [Cryptomeria japonica]